MSGRYRLLGQLETGELAELYAALQDREPVVVKLFHPNTTDARYARDLAETARLLHLVSADGIAHYIDVGLVKGRLAVVRQEVDGPSLGQALQRLATKEVLIPPPVTLALLIELLETVQRAHEGGVLHGALTPGNVFLAPEGHPIIADFGAMRALQAVPALKKIFPQRGRNSYRAPEITRGEPATELSDIYSLGAIAYELLTLRPVLAQGANNGVSTRNQALPPPSRLDRRLNARLDPIIMRALDGLAARRFRSCMEFSNALRNFLTDNGGMPSREDVQKLVRDLSHARPALGAVPFSEPFNLEEVDGADLPPLVERSRVIMARPGFMGGPDPSATAQDAETQEAAPAFEEYKPDPRYDGDEDAPPMDEPVPDDTDPSRAGPLEKGWVAPPGMADLKPRRTMSTVAQSPLAGRPAVRNPRLKVREDYAAPPVEENPFAEDERTDRDPVQKRKSPRMEPDGPKMPEAPPRPSGQKATPDDVPLEPMSVRLAALVPPESVEMSRRELEAALAASTPEALAKQTRRRQFMVGVSLAVAALVVFAVVMLALRFILGDSPATAPSSRRPPIPDPALRAVDGALRKYEEPRPVPPPANPTPKPPAEAVTTPKPPPPVVALPPKPIPAPLPASEPDDVTTYDPPERHTAAFLTITTDMPATVTIDGFKVKKTTPVFKLPVEPGKRRIVLETVATHERRQFDLSFERGKLRHVEEQFRRAR